MFHPVGNCHPDGRKSVLCDFGLVFFVRPEPALSVEPLSPGKHRRAAAHRTAHECADAQEDERSRGG